MTIGKLALACALVALPVMAQDAGTMDTTTGAAQSENPHNTTNKQKTTKKKSKAHDKGAARAGQVEDPNSTDNPKRGGTDATGTAADADRAQTGSPHHAPAGKPDAG